MTGMANFWASQGHEVTLVTFSPSEDFYQLSISVRRMRLNFLAPTSNLLNKSYRFVLLLWRLRQAIRESKPDVVLSFMDQVNVLTLLACVGLGVRVVVAERTNPVHYVIPRVWSRLRDAAYPRASAVVVQTENVRAWAISRCEPDRVHVIPNALDQARLSAMTEVAESPVDPRWEGRIVAVGRMTQEKGHDLLLAACSQVLAERPRWRLELIGDGPLRGALQTQAQALGISEQVYFHGQLIQPFGTVKTADIFVLPSRIEGFPNALMEAMALQRACVSFDCESGPAELIEHGVSGLLVPAQDVVALVAAIRRLVDEPDLRQRLGSQAGQVRHRYAEDATMRKWSEVMGL